MQEGGEVWFYCRNMQIGPVRARWSPFDLHRFSQSNTTSFDTCMVSLMCFEEVGRENEHMIFKSALNTCRWRRRRRRSRIKTRVPKVGTYLGVGSSCHQEIHLDGQRKCVEYFKGKGRWSGSMLQAQIWKLIRDGSGGDQVRTWRLDDFQHTHFYDSPWFFFRIFLDSSLNLNINLPKNK